MSAITAPESSVKTSTSANIRPRLFAFGYRVLLVIHWSKLKLLTFRLIQNRHTPVRFRLDVWGAINHSRQELAFGLRHIVRCGFPGYRLKYRHFGRLLTAVGG
jgi:hypothetical protein